MSSLNENLQSIYNIKLQIKDAIGTNSDVFADYPAMISSMGGGSQSELNTVLALSNTVVVEEADDIEDPIPGVYTYYLNYNNPINQGGIAISLKGEIDGKYVYTYVGFPEQMVIGDGVYTGQVQDTTYNTFAQMLGLPGNYTMEIEKTSDTEWTVTTNCYEEYPISGFEGKLGTAAADPFVDGWYDDETHEYTVALTGLDLGAGHHDGDPVTITCMLQYAIEDISDTHMGLTVQNAYIGGNKTSLLKPANRTSSISIPATYVEGADALEIRIPQHFTLAGITSTVLESTPYIEYTATLFVDQ